jgi:hypothetical protein
MNRNILFLSLIWVNYLFFSISYASFSVSKMRLDFYENGVKTIRVINNSDTTMYVKSELFKVDTNNKFKSILLDKKDYRLEGIFINNSKLIIPAHEGRSLALTVTKNIDIDRVYILKVMQVQSTKDIVDSLVSNEGKFTVLRAYDIELIVRPDRLNIDQQVKRTTNYLEINNIGNTVINNYGFRYCETKQTCKEKAYPVNVTVFSGYKRIFKISKNKLIKFFYQPGPNGSNFGVIYVKPLKG